MTKIEVKINGVNTLVDVYKLEKLENGLFADNYNEDFTVDVNTESAILEAERVQAIKSKAGEIINSKYNIYWQLNHPRVDVKFAKEYAWIDAVRAMSNELEADSTKTVEDFIVEGK